MPVQYKGMEHSNSNINWHSAFLEAIKLELDLYGDSLEFIPEYQLTAEPLRIDCIIIKKPKDLVIKKNIAAIFRGSNLIEYKSPDDFVSVEDFYKVYAYACLFSSFEKVPVTDITISFVESHYPRELLKHLLDIRGFKVEKPGPGIYNILGDIIPIQIIDNRELSEEENLWLRELDNTLNPSELRRITDFLIGQAKEARILAYLDAIARANKDSLQEAIRMDYVSSAFVDVLEETGFLDKVGLVAKLEERKALEIAREMLNSGFSIDTIVSITKLDPEKVKGLST